MKIKILLLMVSLLTVLIGSFASVPPASAQSLVGSNWMWDVTYTENGTPISSETWTATLDRYEMIDTENCSHTTVTIEPDALRYVEVGTEVIVRDSEAWSSIATGMSVKEVADVRYAETMNLTSVYYYTYYDVTPTSWMLNKTGIFYLDSTPVGSDEKIYSVEIVGTEDVTVPAGTFTCDKVFYNLTMVDGTPVVAPLNRTVWTSEEAYSYVKVVDYEAYDGVETWELADFEIIPEFPTWTSLLLVFLVVTVAIAIYKRRLPKTSIH